MVSLKETDLDKMTELQYVLRMVKTYGSLHTGKLPYHWLSRVTI